KPGKFDAGKNGCSLSATGEMRPVGMMLPGNGALPLSGSLIAPPVIVVVGTAEKLPPKNAAGISVDSDVEDCTKRKPSYEAMKKVLFLPSYSFGMKTGPSNSTPN